MPKGKKKVETASEEINPEVLKQGLVGEVEDIVPHTKPLGAEAKTEFAVYTSAGGYVRTYSLADHGEDAEKLAHQFAGKIGGSVR